MLKLQQLIIILFITSSVLFGQSHSLQNYQWGIVPTDENIVGRHENSFIEFKGKFYLIGGRGINPVNVYDPQTNKWETKSKSPFEMHHFQAVTYSDAIYLVGTMTGKYPNETPVENIWLYYPETDTWEKGADIPANRRRGSAGTVVFNDKIYLICGIQLGHTSGTCPWVDSYDFKTGKWEILPDAPHIRDHFPAICVDGKIYCLGGRNTSFHEPDFAAFFKATITDVDCYDIKRKTWTTLPEKLPIGTAAGSLVLMKNKILYIGGESGQARAHSETQAMDLKTGKWEQLNPLSVGRHGTSAILYHDKIYLAAGSGTRGGSNFKTLQVFSNDLGWKSLFNGKNLDGWSVKCLSADREKKFWTVDNGTILCNSLNDSTHNYVWLMNDQEFGNFELKLKFQAFKSAPGNKNSGVQVRSRYNENNLAPEGFWLDGPQVDIDMPSTWRTGFIYDETWEEKRWIYPSLKNSFIDKMYAPKTVIFNFEDGKDQWNDLVIVCNGNKINTYLNNVPVAEYDGEGILNNEAHVKRNVGSSGHIALQLHVKSPIKIRYKDIFVRELK